VSDRLIDWLASVSGDPLAFVLGAFPWGEPGPLANFEGPEPWQIRILTAVRDGLSFDKAIQLATASGHGVGKSALVGWLILWSISTCTGCVGVVTANTETQLKTKTWAELGRWYQRFIAKDRFVLSATALYINTKVCGIDDAWERTWRVDMIPWSERNTEAFAGLHNQGRRILVIFDEASAIPDVIWETTEGALTDANTQIIWCVFGNPTRSTGRFRECFAGGRHSRTWTPTQVDSREIGFTNKQQIEQWIEAYGDDSDFVRIRVKGVFPRTGEMEFISDFTVTEAITRDAVSHSHDPFIIGVDVARYGDNESVIYCRKGRDGQSILPLRLRGLSVVELAGRVAELNHQYQADAVFIDGTGVGGGVVDCLRSMHVSCFDINFGSKPDQIGYAQGDAARYGNKRSEIWGAMRAWLKVGALPNLPDLKAQLVGPTYAHDLQGRILLEKKEDMRRRGLESPDIADALALTFALPVAMHEAAGGPHSKPVVQSEYNPFAGMSLYAQNATTAFNHDANAAAAPDVWHATAWGGSAN
jgi:hypothetical protein